MRSRDFCYWLQGFFELDDRVGAGLAGLNAGQVEIIKRHLALVFQHEIDPGIDAGKTPEQAAKLNDTHDGGASAFPPRMRC